jgi:hypothetical protein
MAESIVFTIAPAFRQRKYYSSSLCYCDFSHLPPLPLSSSVQQTPFFTFRSPEKSLKVLLCIVPETFELLF